MKYSHKLSDAVHVLAYIEICQGEFDLSSNAIALSINSIRVWCAGSCRRW